MLHNLFVDIVQSEQRFVTCLKGLRTVDTIRWWIYRDVDTYAIYYLKVHLEAKDVTLSFGINDSANMMLVKLRNALRD